MHNATSVLDKVADLGLLRFENFDNEKYIVIIDKQTFVEQARTLGAPEFSSSDQTSDAYITINQLAQILGNESAQIRDRLYTGVIPDSLIYFFKPDLFRWIDEL